MKERGLFPVFEGVGGCGKGTQIEIAKNLLLKNGFNVIATREPGGIGESEKIRKLIFDLKERKLIGAKGQTVIFFTARKFWVDGLVAPSIDKGIHVLGDRCYASTGAYQGYAEGGDKEGIILEIADVIMGKHKPDAIILLIFQVKLPGKDVERIRMGTPMIGKRRNILKDWLRGIGKCQKPGGRIKLVCS